jgi:hypothetical protein
MRSVQGHIGLIISVFEEFSDNSRSQCEDRVSGRAASLLVDTSRNHYYSQRDGFFSVVPDKDGGSGVESASRLTGARDPSSLEVGFLSASLKVLFTPCQKLFVKISFIAFLPAVGGNLLLQRESPLSHDTTGRPWIATPLSLGEPFRWMFGRCDNESLPL